MTGAAPVLLLGADGFIGRHIAFALRAEGHEVIACARRTARLAQMGFRTLKADLTRPETHDPGFWRPHLAGGARVINAAGLLTGTQAAFDAVHLRAPAAIYAALDDGAAGLLLSAVGIDAAETDFARYRRDGEALAAQAGLTILRPGLVLGDTSYGGSSLARALAALPFVTPVVGGGAQLFNPIHTTDLAAVVIECLETPPGPGAHQIGGPERITQAEMLQSMRSWMGLRPTRALPVPLPLARTVGRLGDALRLGPVSRTSVAQLETGVEADESALLPHLTSRPRGFRAFLNARPAGTQDLWHARLYLMRPIVRLGLALLWLISGLMGLLLPAQGFLPLVPDTALSDTALTVLARIGGVVDLAIAAALLRGWRTRLMAGIQALVVAGYTAAFTLLAPALWLLPLGGLLKNLPVLLLIAISAILEEER